jgi:amino acid permease
MAVFSFSFIAFSIIGVIKNRKTNKVATIKYKHTIWSGYTAIVMIFIVLILTIIEPFASIGIATNRYYQTLNNSTLTILEKQTQLQNIKSTLISHILTSILFILYTTISFTSMYIEKLVALKRHKKLTKLISSEINKNKKELLLISNELNNKLLMTYNVF